MTPRHIRRGQSVLPTNLIPSLALTVAGRWCTLAGFPRGLAIMRFIHFVWDWLVFAFRGESLASMAVRVAFLIITAAIAYLGSGAFSLQLAGSITVNGRLHEFSLNNATIATVIIVVVWYSIAFGMTWARFPALEIIGVETKNDVDRRRIIVHNHSRSTIKFSAQLQSPAKVKTLSSAATVV